MWGTLETRPLLVAHPASTALRAAHGLRGRPKAAACLSSSAPSSSDRGRSRSPPGRAFRKAARGAGLRDFHFRDLRQHGASMALNKGLTAAET
jgi:hypothetical protein